ncbi:MAG: hypothetical protein WD010_08830 [Nitriliruptor sp.]|uniref:hypothetical protein n=1 Tax=Nitriliruptor sp. TaxID=2448056 RepID=UPI0034A05150
MAADRPIRLPHQGAEGRLWNALLDVADAQPKGWTLIGALMVMLHAHAAGLDARRTTRDADALADTRGVTLATRRLVATLERLGWEMHPDHPRADDVGFRFVKDELLLDVLAPDGLGARTDITTVPPLTTVSIPGGSQALRRTAVRHVVVGDRQGRLPVPDLLGALIIKARAAAKDRGPTSDPEHRPERHPEDLAVLFACATDLRAVADGITSKERKALRDAPEPHWHVLDPDLRPQAQATRRFLAQGPTPR